MNETEINILINRKSDLGLIKQKIIDSTIRFPIYIMEYEDYYHINITSDYGEWELETAILKCFPQYEFVGHPGTGRREIRLEFSRSESEFGMDGWGGRNENPINETKYLVKKAVRNDKPVKFSQKITVLFDDQEFFYHTNIIDGINKRTEEKGFLLLNNFRAPVERENTEILQDRMYKSPLEAFNFGFYKIQDLAQEDFKIFIDNKKKKVREIQRIPRKIVREFIKHCNLNDFESIRHGLHANVRFEKKIGWKTNYELSGSTELIKYLQSQEQNLCKMNIRIRSTWNIELPYISIGIENVNTEKLSSNDCRRMNFTIIDNKITEIVLEE